MQAKIFLGSLPREFNRKVLYNHFSRFGGIKSLKVLKDAKKKCTGCAILVCENQETRDTILGIEHKLFGKLIECHEYKRGRKLKQYNQELWRKRVFVKQIPQEFSTMRLKVLFEEMFGEVKFSSLNKMRRKKRQQRGLKTGFVTFERLVDAKKACDAQVVRLSNGHEIMIVQCNSRDVAPEENFCATQQKSMEVSNSPRTNNSSHNNNRSHHQELSGVYSPEASRGLDQQ